MKLRTAVYLIAVVSLCLTSAQGQTPPKDSGTFSVGTQSATQAQYDAAYAEGVAAGGCRVWCQRFLTLAPIFWCDGGGLFNCSCPEGSGVFVLWREYSKIVTSVKCSEFYEGIAFNFNDYYNSCYSYPGYSDWNYDACPDGYHWSCTNTACVRNSPIVIDINGDGFDLTGPVSGVLFNFSRDGLDRMGWTKQGSDDAFLVLDRNGNGVIEDGFELFGNLTPQRASKEPNGFLALAEYDKAENGGNGDSVIDHRDAVFATLRLWQDNNHNATSESYELHTLQSLGIVKIELRFHLSKKVDEYGNEFKYRAKVWRKGESKAGRWAWDVFFAGGPEVLGGPTSTQREENRFGLISMLGGLKGSAQVCRKPQ